MFGESATRVPTSVATEASTRITTQEDDPVKRARPGSELCSSEQRGWLTQRLVKERSIHVRVPSLRVHSQARREDNAPAQVHHWGT